MKRRVLGIAAFAGMLVLILDGKTALQGAKDGVDLCIRTVIPSLFPYFVLSNLLAGAYLGTPIPILWPLGALYGFSEGMESLMIPAFLGGYPVGAQTVAQAWRSGQLPKEEAQRLLAFCNNAGPSFLFGMVAVMFPKPWMAWLLWCIHLVSAFLTARLFPANINASRKIAPQQISVTQMLRRAITAMGSVCGWIVFFRVWIAFLDRWFLWLLPETWRVLAVGMLELSNGCMSLQGVSDIGLRFILCSGMLAFGGVCVMMQVASAAEGLSLKWFFTGKLAQTILSLAFSWAIVSGEFIIFGFFLLLAPLLFIKTRKKGSIPDKAGV